MTIFGFRVLSSGFRVPVGLRLLLLNLLVPNETPKPETRNPKR